jgi:DNA-binding protein YbaB
MAEDALKDEIIAMVKTTTTRVERIEAALAKIEDFDESLPAKGTRSEIESGMGSVVVDGHGLLVRVQLNADSFDTGDVSQLGSRVVKAILAAQQSAKEAREAHIDQLAGEMWQ